MAKVLLVKVEYEDRPRKIDADDVKEENMKFIALKDGKKVGEFPLHKVEYWSLDNVE